MTESKNL